MVNQCVGIVQAAIIIGCRNALEGQHHKMVQHSGIIRVLPKGPRQLPVKLTLRYLEATFVVVRGVCQQALATALLDQRSGFRFVLLGHVGEMANETLPFD
jgi:hypothetical protein